MRTKITLISMLLIAAIPLAAQSFLAFAPDASAPDVRAVELARRAPDLSPSPAFAAPRMSPDLALDTYQQHSRYQVVSLASYTASTVIQAELPHSAQRAELELQRQYTAPSTLQFKAVRYAGDGFVKSNVILRVLQSEVEHVQKQQGSQTAITSANYKFSYKGVETLEGQRAHVFAVKPRQKRPGLFRGKIYLDVATGSLRRAEGTLVKSPSFFIKRVDFVQEYADFNGFTFPVHMHSVAKTRMVGDAVVDIVTRDYAPAVQTAQMMGAAVPVGN